MRQQSPGFAQSSGRNGAAAGRSLGTNAIKRGDDTNSTRMRTRRQIKQRFAWIRERECQRMSLVSGFGPRAGKPLEMFAASTIRLAQQGRDGSHSERPVGVRSASDNGGFRSILDYASCFARGVGNWQLCNSCSYAMVGLLKSILSTRQNGSNDATGHKAPLQGQCLSL